MFPRLRVASLCSAGRGSHGMRDTARQAHLSRSIAPSHLLGRDTCSLQPAIGSAAAPEALPAAAEVMFQFVCAF